MNDILVDRLIACINGVDSDVQFDFGEVLYNERGELIDFIGGYLVKNGFFETALAFNAAFPTPCVDFVDVISNAAARLNVKLPHPQYA